MEQDPAERLLATIHGLPPRHVSEAMDALHGSRNAPLCGRPTKAGRPCRQLHARFTGACTSHATGDEQAATLAEHTRLTALVGEWRASLTPACHSWPVTDEDRRAVANVPDGPDELVAARHVYELIWQWQRGRCAVCGGQGQEWGPGYWDSSDFVLDHDHGTASVRGWLCRSCNVSEPHSDSGDFAKYRARPPALVLGVRARYEHPFYGLVQPEAPAYRLLSRFSRA